MFHSLLVINSPSHETAVPTDEKEVEEEEEEEGRGDKKQKIGCFDDNSPFAAEFAAVSPIRSFSASPASFSFPYV